MPGGPSHNCGDMSAWRSLHGPFADLPPRGSKQADQAVVGDSCLLQNPHISSAGVSCSVAHPCSLTTASLAGQSHRRVPGIMARSRVEAAQRATSIGKAEGIKRCGCVVANKAARRNSRRGVEGYLGDVVKKSKAGNKIKEAAGGGVVLLHRAAAGSGCEGGTHPQRGASARLGRTADRGCGAGWPLAASRTHAHPTPSQSRQMQGGARSLHRRREGGDGDGGSTASEATMATK